MLVKRNNMNKIGSSEIIYSNITSEERFEIDGVFNDELWIRPAFISSSRRLITSLYKMQTVNKLVLYPFLADFTNRKRVNRRWIAIAIDKKGTLFPTYTYETLQKPRSVITISNLRSDNSEFVKALSDELSMLTNEQMEAYAGALQMYKTKRRFFVEAQSDDSKCRYGRVKSYNVVGVYFKPFPPNVLEWLQKNKE